METGYYWIIRKDCEHREVAKYDSDIEMFFTIGSSSGLILNDIDLKKPLIDCKNNELKAIFHAHRYALSGTSLEKTIELWKEQK